jgi:hypothetical protein
MRSGLFPAQQRMLRRLVKKADKFDSFRQRSRRALFGCGILAGLTGLVAGFGAGGGLECAATPPTSALDPLLTRGLQMAIDADDNLLRDALPFLLILEAHSDHAGLWIGYGRLARMVIDAPAGERRELAARLSVTAHNHQPPAHLAGLVEELRRRQ